MGIVKARKLGVTSKIFLFSKMVQDYENRSADICLVMLELYRVSLIYLWSTTESSSKIAELNDVDTYLCS